MASHEMPSVRRIRARYMCPDFPDSLMPSFNNAYDRSIMLAVGTLHPTKLV